MTDVTKSDGQSVENWDQEKEQDQKAAETVLARWRQRPEPPLFKLDEGGNGTPALKYAAERDAGAQLRMRCATGLKNSKAVELLTEQLLRLSATDIEQCDATRLNRAIALLDELAPTNGAEGMLAAQMVAIHITSMQCLSRANLEGQTFEGRELNLKFSAKLARVFAQQMQTLDKMRRGGQQKVTVEHVHVHDGGQAIVGSVETGGCSKK